MKQPKSHAGNHGKYIKKLSFLRHFLAYKCHYSHPTLLTVFRFTVLFVPWKLLQRLFYCFLLPDWLKLNHLKSQMECGLSDIFSRHICSTVAETIGVTNNAASFGAKNVQKTTFEAAEMMLGPWNQQVHNILESLKNETS